MIIEKFDDAILLAGAKWLTDNKVPTMLINRITESAKMSSTTNHYNRDDILELALEAKNKLLTIGQETKTYYM